MAYVDLKAVSRLLRDLVAQGPLMGFGDAVGRKAQDLQNILQVLETLNYVWTDAQFQNDRLTFLVYVAL